MDLVKRCNRCNQIKSLQEFNTHLNKHNTIIHSSYCTLCRRETARIWNAVNREKHAGHQAKWRAANKELDIQRSTDRLNKLEHRIKSRLRSRLRDAIKNGQKTGSAIRDLGCSIEELKTHIESQWQPGMNWDNWTVRGWHIDHIIPMAKFDLSDPEQLRKACHYTNLQPLWAKDNLSKSDS